MIGRYTRPEMGRIWELENKFAIWKEIEVLACEAQAELGQAGITREEAQWIRDHADFTVEEIDEIEKVTNHDVIAFTTCMAGYIDADIPEGEDKPSRWVHYGMTSSDLGDTALSYQVTQLATSSSTTSAASVKPASAAPSSSRTRCASAAPWHSRRAHDLRHEVRQLGLGLEARPHAHGGGPRRGRHRRYLGSCGHLLFHRSLRGAVRLREAGPYSRPAFHPGARSRPPRPGDGRAGRDRLHA